MKEEKEDNYIDPILKEVMKPDEYGNMTVFITIQTPGQIEHPEESVLQGGEIAKSPKQMERWFTQGGPLADYEKLYFKWTKREISKESLLRTLAYCRNACEQKREFFKKNHSVTLNIQDFEIEQEGSDEKQFDEEAFSVKLANISETIDELVDHEVFVIEKYIQLLEEYPPHIQKLIERGYLKDRFDGTTQILVGGLQDAMSALGGIEKDFGLAEFSNELIRKYIKQSNGSDYSDKSIRQYRSRNK